MPNLTRLVLGKGVTWLGTGMFGQAKVLEYGQLPSRLARIDYGIGSMKILVCLAPTPPNTSASGNALISSAGNLQAIYVPDASVDAYKNSTYKWKNYAAKIKPLSEYTGRIYYEAD